MNVDKFALTPLVFSHALASNMVKSLVFLIVLLIYKSRRTKNFIALGSGLSKYI
jgi:hypothetical protein